MAETNNTGAPGQEYFIGKRLPTALLFVAVVSLYYISLSGGLLWNDVSLVGRMAASGPAELAGSLGSVYEGPEDAAAEYFAPLALASLFLDGIQWKQNPVWYHLENAMLLFITAYVLLRVLLVLFDDLMLAFFATMLFALHPLAVEPVNYMSARGSLLSLLFALVSVRLLLKARDGTGVAGGRKGWYALSLVCFLLSLLSGETGLILPVFLVTLALSGKATPCRPVLRATLPFLALALVYMALRLKFHYSHAFHSGDGTLSMRILDLFYEYVKMPLFPAGLHASMDLSNYSNNFAFRWLAGALLALALTALMLLRWTPAVLRVGVVWVLAGFLPYYGVVPFLHLPLEPRYVYYALPGFCLMAAWALRALFRRNPHFGWLSFVGVAAALTITTYGLNGTWKDDFLLWEDAVRKSPTNYMAYYRLARANDNIHAVDNAINYYQSVLTLKPEHKDSHTRLGNIYKSLGAYERARSYYKEALMIPPEEPWIHLNLGDIYMEEGDTSTAIDHYGSYIDAAPANADVHFRLALAYTKLKDTDAALWHFGQALAVRPKYPEAHYGLAQLYEKLGDKDRAVQELRVALIINATYRDARLMYNRLGGEQKISPR